MTFQPPSDFLFLRTTSASPIRLLFGLIFCLICIGSSHGQVRKDLEKKRQKLIKEIKLTNNLLNETTRGIEAAMDRYKALQNQIESREELILTLQEEVQFADISMQRSADVIEALKLDIERLKAEYGRMARHALRHKMTQSNAQFLLSASGFNDLIKRWRYLRQYDQYRQKQARLIVETQNTLTDKLRKLEIVREEKQDLIAEEEAQNQILAKELTTKKRILNNLKNDEKRLKRRLRQHEITHRQLNDAIEKVIREEVAAARRKARSRNPTNRKPSLKAPETGPLAAAFRNNRGRLPWPVKQGVITGFFGKQKHPTLRRVEITNNGIDIRTDRRAKVQAVFAGEVVGTQYIPGHYNMIILKHGDYYTVYSNLEELFVAKGQQIKAKQSLGQLAVDSKSNKSEVHFEIWRDKQRLNPVNWIARR